MVHHGDDINNGCQPEANVGISSYFKTIWTNTTHGKQVHTMSHLCLDGSLSHLSREDWKMLCFPTDDEEVRTLAMIGGIWALITLIVGACGNLLTLMAIPYAKYKRRHGFEKTFWTTDIWIMNLALCDLIFCLLALPYRFIIPWLDLRYPQYPGSDLFCSFSMVTGILTIDIDWLLLSLIAMTRAFKIKYPQKWLEFCHNKVYVGILLIFPWVFGFLLSFVIRLVAPGMDFGYNCLMGFCFFIPTGEISAYDEEGRFWFLNVLPNAFVFLVPYTIIIVSYIIIWRHIRNIKAESRDILNIEVENKTQLSDTEIKFIWTILIVCVCYLVSSVPITINRFRMESTDVYSCIIVLSLMMCQYTINIFIYTYRSVNYRKAYLDLLNVFFPCHGKRKTVKYLLPSEHKTKSKEATSLPQPETKRIKSNPSTF